MQVFDIEYSQNGLRDFMVAHGGLDYFDEIEIGAEVSHDSYNYWRTVLRKNGTEIPIDIENSAASTYYPIWINGTPLYVSNNAYLPRYIRYGYVTDSAIVLIPRRSNSSSDIVLYRCPIIICKTQKGYPCIIYGGEGDSAGYTDSNNSSTFTRCIIIDDEGVKTEMSTGNIQNNRNDNILTTSPIPGKVDIAKDVYYVVNRPFYQTAQPFMLDIDGVSYASFAYNTILIKTA